MSFQVLHLSFYLAEFWRGMQARLDLGKLTITSEKHELFDAPLRQASNGHLLLPLMVQQPEFATNEECAHAEHLVEDQWAQYQSEPWAFALPFALPGPGLSEATQ